MAGYMEPCIYCGALVEPDARFCPKCGVQSPLALHCPSCLREIKKGDMLCAGCGRPLYITCPNCGQQTFVQERCERCGGGLMVVCKNKRCGALQFFQNEKCTACGKKLK